MNFQNPSLKLSILFDIEYFELIWHLGLDIGDFFEKSTTLALHPIRSGQAFLRETVYVSSYLISRIDHPASRNTHPVSSNPASHITF